MYVLPCKLYLKLVVQFWYVCNSTCLHGTALQCARAWSIALVLATAYLSSATYRISSYTFRSNRRLRAWCPHLILLQPRSDVRPKYEASTRGGCSQLTATAAVASPRHRRLPPPPSLLLPAAQSLYIIITQVAREILAGNWILIQYRVILHSCNYTFWVVVGIADRCMPYK